MPAVCELSAKLPATLEAVNGFCENFRTWRRENCADLDAFGAELLIREALTNSVVHGCRQDTAKCVRCVVRVKQGRAIIRIHDEGAGFDWRAASKRAARLEGTSGRGVEILRKYANRVRFSPSGNSVTLLKRF